MKFWKKNRRLSCGWTLQADSDHAVSPVVGVMLMLVVTIIIAAIVSGFAGGLIGENNQKAPTLNIDVKITNSGNYRGSEFSADVTGVSEPIPTSDLKIITSWTTTVKTNYSISSSGNPVAGKGCILSLPIGAIYHGGAEILPGIANSYTQKTARSVAPYGFGPGVINLTTSDMGRYMYNGPMTQMYNWQFYSTTHFGNYSLVQGTVMMAEAGGRCINYPVTGGYPDTFTMGGYGTQTRKNVNGVYVTIPHTYAYKTGNVYGVYTGSKTTPLEILADGGQIDGMQAMLGCGWENLRGGDTVNVKIVHLPTGKTVFDKDIVVDYS